MATNTDQMDSNGIRRRILAATVGAIAQECGFHSIDKAAVGTLVEMMEALHLEIARTAKTYCEVAFRSEPVIADIILALADLGINYDGIQAFAKRQNRIVISNPGQQVEPKQNNVLQVGDKKPFPGHIPDNLPPFPDTHTYCFSHTYKQPVTEYEAIREKSALQKRDIEKALTKFGTKTHDATNLFHSEDKEYLLMTVQPTKMPFHDALMPRDQVFEEDELHLASLIRRRKEEKEQDSENKERDRDQNDAEMDNPYLRPVKMPKKKSKKL